MCSEESFRIVEKMLLSNDEPCISAICIFLDKYMTRGKNTIQMSDRYPKFKAAVAQLTPSFLNREETVEIACKGIEEAGRNGARLIAFPESFIPGYPYWLWMEPPFSAARYFKDFFKNSVTVPSPSTKLLCQSARKAQCYVVMGMTLREGGTLYNAMLFIDDKGEIMGYRRKLVPTVVERTIWGRGDGSDLCVFDTELGKIGGLICGENNMYLVKYALLAKGEQIHIANFPGSPLKPMAGFTEAIDVILKSSAILGQIFVLNAINFVSKEMEQKIFDTDAKREEFYIHANNGGSSIFAPSGMYLAKPVLDEEMILYADIDMEMVISAKWASDCTGHYARPDVTQLLVNEERYVTYETRKTGLEIIRKEDDQELRTDLEKLAYEIDKSGTQVLKKQFAYFARKYGLQDVKSRG
jgi:aliphatic nitrilase